MHPTRNLIKILRFQDDAEPLPEEEAPAAEEEAAPEESADPAAGAKAKPFDNAHTIIYNKRSLA